MRGAATSGGTEGRRFRGSGHRSGARLDTPRGPAVGVAPESVVTLGGDRGSSAAPLPRMPHEHRALIKSGGPRPGGSRDRRSAARRGPDRRVGVKPRGSAGWRRPARTVRPRGLPSRAMPGARHVDPDRGARRSAREPGRFGPMVPSGAPRPRDGRRDPRPWSNHPSLPHGARVPRIASSRGDARSRRSRGSNVPVRTRRRRRDDSRLGAGRRQRVASAASLAGPVTPRISDRNLFASASGEFDTKITSLLRIWNLFARKKPSAWLKLVV